MRALISIVLLSFTVLLHAQDYPSRAVRIIVPLPAGSTTDLVMRTTAQELSQRLKQPVVVENKPGGNWVVGAEACHTATPDGHTLCVMNSDAIAFNPYILSSLP